MRSVHISTSQSHHCRYSCPMFPPTGTNCKDMTKPRDARSFRPPASRGIRLSSPSVSHHRAFPQQSVHMEQHQDFYSHHRMNMRPGKMHRQSCNISFHIVRVLIRKYNPYLCQSARQKAEFNDYKERPCTPTPIPASRTHVST